jgi:hypothetical protein
MIRIGNLRNEYNILVEKFKKRAHLEETGVDDTQVDYKGVVCEGVNSIQVSTKGTELQVPYKTKNPDQEDFYNLLKNDPGPWNYFLNTVGFGKVLVAAFHDVEPVLPQPTARVDLADIIPTFDPLNNILLSITVTARPKARKSSPTQTTQGMAVCLRFYVFVLPYVVEALRQADRQFKQSYQPCIRIVISEFINSEREHVRAQSVKVLDKEYFVTGKHYEAVSSFLHLPATSSF